MPRRPIGDRAMTPAERQRRRREALKQEHPAKPKRSREITNSRQGYGTSMAYRVAKLMRDHPNIVKRMAAGEFRSVRHGEREAGAYTDPTPLERLAQCWQKTPPDDQDRFLCAVLGCTDDELSEFMFSTESAEKPLTDEDRAEIVTTYSIKTR